MVCRETRLVHSRTKWGQNEKFPQTIFPEEFIEEAVEVILQREISIY